MSKRPNFISTVMAAKILGFTPDYVRRLISQGKINAQKIGHDWIMVEKDIKHITRQRKERIKEA